MSAVVVVNPAPAGAGGGGPAPLPTTPPDTAPVSSLIAPGKQRAGKLYVRASMNEAGTLAAAGTVSVPGAAKVYRLKSTSRKVSPNQSIKLRLELSKKAVASVRRALKHNRKVSARVTVTAEDTTGHRTVRKQTIRLTR